jgi:glycosyltransferase involved in cell wall biosynthesis
MTEDAPLVSTIVAVRNGAPLLADALRSIEAQTYRPIEVVVIDGHSTDRTAEIAASFPSVRYHLQDGLGVADAYNQGVRAARGTFIAFLSHDDVWLPDKIERQVAFLREHPGVDYVICHLLWEQIPGTAIPPGFRREQLTTPTPGMCMETLLVRRRVFDTVGCFDTGLRSNEDADWYARANDCSMVRACLPELLLRKRLSGSNFTFAPHIATNSDSDLLAIMRASVGRKRSQD